ncbi:AraC family ligand binding domain-containing protein, partial [Sphingobacterium sp.]
MKTGTFQAYLGTFAIMARENMHKSLEVYYEKVDCCPLSNRQFNFFEFVYVLSGNGSHGINGNEPPFEAGDLFLITPNDYHSFSLDQVCEFMVIRFAPSYVKSYSWQSIDHIECLLYYASHFSGSILTNETDRLMVHTLMKNLQQTTVLNSIYSEDLTRHLVNAIIVIAARNISVIRPPNISPHADIRLLQILDYIHEHIRQPELLKIAAIAGKF